MLALLWLEAKTRPMTSRKWFDKLTLLIGLGNPVALSIQLKELWFDEGVDYESISLGMWISFLTIQVAVAFEAIKRKDLSSFFRMVLSIIITLSVIITVSVHS